MYRLMAGMLLALFIGIGGIAGVLWQAVSRQPQVIAVQPLSRADLERGRRLYHQLQPIGLRGRQTRTVTLTAQDLEVGMNYLLGRAGGGRARVRFAAGALELDFAVPLHRPLAGRYLNASLALVPSGRSLRLVGMRLGQLPLPMALVRPLLVGALAASPDAARLQVLDAMLRQVSIQGERMRVTLVWNGQVARAFMDTLGQQISGVGAEPLAAYRQRLAHLAAARPRPSSAVIIGELFALARQRSAQGDAVSENRALLITLAEETNRLRLGLPGGGGQPLVDLKLAGRGDFLQHFTLSAALSAVAGEALADMAGLYKEVRDTQGGSGFSFTDLAANRAGARFGSLATASQQAARRVQERLAGSRDTALYAPRISDFPEYLPDQVFQRDYGGVGGEGYLRLVAKIEARIAALPLYRQIDGRL